jgi:hypothetical protein
MLKLFPVGSLIAFSFPFQTMKTTNSTKKGNAAVERTKTAIAGRAISAITARIVGFVAQNTPEASGLTI